MKNCHIWSLILLSTSMLSAWEISGTVRDIDHRPLADIVIMVTSEDIRAVSNDRGHFYLSIPDSYRAGEKITIKAEAASYYPDARTIILKKEKITIDFLLVPQKLLKEEITVTALNEKEKNVSIPFAQSIISQMEIKESQPESVVAAVAQGPGVSFIGKGGISVTPSIRGLARRRILLMLDGARIISDRSAGAAASFVPPDFIQRIEVVRSAASVIYGSDAMGGVINILTRPESAKTDFFGGLNVNGALSSQRLGGSLSLGKQWDKLGASAQLQYGGSEDYRSPEGIVNHSGYSYATGMFSLSYRSEKRTFFLRFMKSSGKNVGKPERANDPNSYSFYPSEQNNMLQMEFQETKIRRLGHFTLQLFLNPNSYDLNKVKVSSSQVDLSLNRSLDMGARAFFRKEVSPSFTYQWGFDYFGRQNVDMENQSTKKDEVVSETFPVQNGTRGDLGAYLTFDYAGFKSFDLVGGFRYGSFWRQALSNNVFMEKKSQAPALFLGLTRTIKEHVTLFANVGTAFRMPSLSEAFYTGITGRTRIVGNSDLKPEHSLNFDMGIRLHGQKLYAGLYLFHYTIRNMIEKYKINESDYSYDNIEKGQISGLELEIQLHPIPHLEIYGNGFYYYGKSPMTQQPLNDVPAPRLLLGSRFWKGRFWLEANWLWSAKMTRPGPAEVENDSYECTDVRTGYYLSSRCQLFLKASNIFNAPYYPNADPDIPLAPGIDLSLGLAFLF